VDIALAKAPTIQKCLVVKRTGQDTAMKDGRDVWYHDAMATANADCPAEELDSEHLCFILYTSGTTGKPKGVVHTTAGYLLGAHLTTKYVFDIKDSDVYWCTADIGWVTGHSYIVYGPLSNGATVMLYEGAPNTPKDVIGGGRCPIVDTWWQTETGAIMCTPLPGVTPTKPGSCTRPFFGVDAAVVDKQGHEVPANAGGYFVIRKPWPSMLRTLYGDD